MVMTQVRERKHVARLLPGRRERRKAETRERLFRAAMRLFAERGFFETTTENITEAADVGLGTFFNYFPSKHHVFTVLSEKQIEKVKAACLQAEAAIRIPKALENRIHSIPHHPAHSQPLTRTFSPPFISTHPLRAL